ncbi:MAG TPA: hypothetical protein VE986_02980 [Hyphomicrobiales bacterium]|nr:hypothetical protein [Hyphomicrobiales bacterium]
MDDLTSTIKIAVFTGIGYQEAGLTPAMKTRRKSAYPQRAIRAAAF